MKNNLFQDCMDELAEAVYVVVKQYAGHSDNNRYTGLEQLTDKHTLQDAYSALIKTLPSHDHSYYYIARYTDLTKLIPIRIERDIHNKVRVSISNNTL